MHVTTYEDVTCVPASDWDQVVDRVGAPVFYRHAYLAAHAAAGVATPLATRFLVVRETPGGEPLAVCPATLQQPADPLGILERSFPGFRADDRCLLSHFWQCYDTSVPAVSTEAARCAAEALIDVAADMGARWVGLVNMTAGSPTTDLGVLKDWQHAEVDERFRRDLTSVGTIEDYLREVGGHTARNMRRYLRRAADRAVRVEQLDVANAHLDEAIGLIRATAARHGNTVLYPDGPFQDFVRRLGDSVTAVEIRDGGRLVAVGLCLVDAERFHLWTAGAADVEGARYSPYGLLFLECVRAAITSGRRTLEGGRRNREYKERHGLTRVPLVAALRLLA